VSAPTLWTRWVKLFEEDDDSAPRYDPVHLATVVVACQVVAGALYWLLWTLFVYDGGLPSKVGPFLRVATGAATLQDYGWLGTPDRQGRFEGWAANLAAFALCLLVVTLLYRADRRHGRRAKHAR
jgi:hypothetical protein